MSSVGENVNAIGDPNQLAALTMIGILSGNTVHPAGWHTPQLFAPLDDDKERRDRDLKGRRAAQKNGAKYRWEAPYAEHMMQPLSLAVTELTRLNKLRMGIFVAVNDFDGKPAAGKPKGVGREKTNITAVRAVWADDDTVRPDRLPRTDWPLVPTLVTETSPGKFQYYWCVTGLTVDECVAVNRGIAAKFGADANATDATRVLRLAGFWHCKRADAPFQVRIAAEGPRHNRDQILAAFPPLVIETPARPAYAPGGTRSPSEVALVRSALAAIPETVRADRGQWIKVGHALYHHFGGEDEGGELFAEFSWDRDEGWSVYGTFRGSAADGGNAGIGTVYKLAKDHGGWDQRKAHLAILLAMMPVTGAGHPSAAQVAAHAAHVAAFTAEFPGAPPPPMPPAPPVMGAALAMEAVQAELDRLKLEYEADMAAALVNAKAAYAAVVAAQGNMRLENPRPLLLLLAATEPDDMERTAELKKLVQLSHGLLGQRDAFALFKDARKVHAAQGSEIKRAYFAKRDALYMLIHGPVESADGSMAAELSDDWLALAFATKHQHEFKYVADWGAWASWNGKSWAKDPGLTATDAMRVLCRTIPDRFPEHASVGDASTIAGALKLATSDSRLAASADQWDKDDWLLNTPAGIIDLKTGQMGPHDPKRFMMKMTAVSPAVGTCPVFMNFLLQATGGDFELIGFLRRWGGYTLTGLIKEQIITFLVGEGGTGKGTFITTLQKCLGDYAVSTQAEVFEEKPSSDRHPTEIARMQGARFVVGDEYDPSRYWSEKQLKRLTGGNVLSARFMRQDFFDFMPNFNIVMAGNSAPKLPRLDGAIIRRLIIVQFDQKAADLPGGVDTDLGEKLKAEYPQILQWFVDGCLEWQRVGLKVPESVRAGLQKFVEEHDTIGLFIEEECTIDPLGRVKLKDLFDRFRIFTAEHHLRAGTSPVFKDDLASRGFHSRKMNDGQNVNGIRLRTAGDRMFGVIQGGVGMAGPAPTMSQQR